MSKRVLTLTVMSVLGLLAATASPLRSQEAETARISHEVVVVEAWANAVPLTLRIVNGEMARLSTSGGLTYGLTPSLTAEGVNLFLFEIERTGSGGERMRQLERLPAASGARMHFGPHPLQLEVRFVGREPLHASGGSSKGCRPGRVSSSEEIGNAAGPDAACARCCVTCDGIRACACAVSMSCGSSCCEGDSCGYCP